MIAAKNLSFGLQRTAPLVENLSFNLEAGSVLTLTGSNGVGKSTLLRWLNGQAPQFGSGKLAINADSKALMTQIYQPNFHIPLSLSDVIGIANRSQQMKTFGLFDEEDLERPWQYASGGERQKALFIRTLLQGPQLLLLDEPNNHLDKHSEPLFWRALTDYIRDKGSERAAVIVCHGNIHWPDPSLPCQHLDLDQFRSRS